MAAAFAALLVTACGDDAVLVRGPESVTIVQTGGCAMTGPNCPTWVLSPDGTFIVGRGTDTVPVADGTIDPATAESLFAEIVATDFRALLARLGPGSCQACVDGIDTAVSFELSHKTVALNSVEVDFTTSEPFFHVLDETIEAMSRATPLPLMTR